MWKKLQVKSNTIAVLNPPHSFLPLLDEIARDCTVVCEAPEVAKQNITFLLAFVTRQSQLHELTSCIDTGMKGDPVVWLAYPKTTSKLHEDVSRDKGFESIGKIGIVFVHI
jgi:hypothetical protein